MHYQGGINYEAQRQLFERCRITINTHVNFGGPYRARRDRAGVGLLLATQSIMEHGREYRLRSKYSSDAWASTVDAGIRLCVAFPTQRPPDTKEVKKKSGPVARCDLKVKTTQRKCEPIGLRAPMGSITIAMQQRLKGALKFLLAILHIPGLLTVGHSM